LHEILYTKTSPHPIYRFPLWFWRRDGKLFVLTDADLSKVVFKLNPDPNCTYLPSRPWLILCHSALTKLWDVPIAHTVELLDAYRKHYPEVLPPEKTGLFFGFADMPAEVAQKLRWGQMRKLQRLCGWAKIEFHEGSNVLCTARGFDGSVRHYDKSGRQIDYEHESDAWTPRARRQ